MALVITDRDGRDIRELENIQFDLAYGSDENNWELTIHSASDVRLNPGCRVYLEGTEYGGIYDGRKVDTEKREITYSGRTWSGVLAQRIIVPGPGVDYVNYGEDSNRLIERIVTSLALGDLFSAPTEDAGIHVSGRFNRYIDAYQGLCNALSASGAKLKMSYNGDKVLLYAERAMSYTDGRALDADEIALVVKQTRGSVNHLICAGQGQLRNRITLHLYADRKHVISTKQTLFGVDEVAEFYDYSNADAQELREKGIEKLRDLQKSSEKIEATISSKRELDIGDIVGAHDPETGANIEATVTKKIVSMNGNATQIEYKATTAAEVSVLE